MNSLESLNKKDGLSKPLSKPWEPSSQLVVADKDPRFSYRWCSVDSLEKKLAEGWEVVCKTVGDKVTVDGALQKPDNTYRKGRLILCRIPKEIATEMKEYWRKQSGIDLIKAEAAKLKKEMSSDNTAAYGGIKIG